MAEQNMTVWQRLSQTFGPNSLLNQDYPTFKFDKKELLRTKSREEYEQDTGEEIEMDVIGICCDFAENDFASIAEDYSIQQ